MTKKVIAFGCWSNEMPIAEKGQCGVLHGRLFSTEKLAREYYEQPDSFHCGQEDVIVRVTCEVIEK
jgi:hypothetical protein